jgi:ribosomal protein S18 acetylase RimI-like enzyme
MSFKIRSYEPKDLDAVYEVCLKTGDAGQDATRFHKDPKALGHLYVGPYVTLEPSLAFVLEDSLGVCGYVLGASDTKTFYQRYLAQWLPPLQQLYPDPIGDPETWTFDEQLYHALHHPDDYKTFDAYPSHLHIDLLPRAQGQGNGKSMMQILLGALQTQGSKGVFLVMHLDNTRAFHFYLKMGFQIIEDPTLPRDGLYLGLAFE